MSEMSSETYTVYAVSNDRPPDAWHSDWTLLGGIRVGGGDIPTGYVQVDESGYADALRAQTAAAVRSEGAAIYDQRRMYSDQRKALVGTGMTWEQARILVPDPENDYSIDDD